MTPPQPPADPADARAEGALQSLAGAIVRHTREDGLYTHPRLPALSLFRCETAVNNICGVYEPSVALIVQGSKRVMLGGDTFTYGRRDVLITSLNLPTVGQITEASPHQPFLSLLLRLDLTEIGRLMADSQLPPPRGPAPPRERAMAIGQATWPLLRAVQRLVDLLDEPEGLPIIAPLVQREILYWLLVSDQGGRLRQIGSAGTQGQRIARAIDWLRVHYARPLRVEELASEVRMSASTFHHHFRELTAMSPLQYQKWLRLNEARRLMLAEGLDASTAAYRVGYESPSQFSREYSRQFGAPPTRDIAGLRSAAPTAAVSPA